MAELTGKRSRIKGFEELMRKLLIQINKSGAHGHGEVQGEGGREGSTLSVFMPVFMLKVEKSKFLKSYFPLSLNVPIFLKK